MNFEAFERQIIKETRERRRQVCMEAYCLLGVIQAGELPSLALMERAEFHLHSLAEQFPNISESRMAHMLAVALRFNPQRGFWARLKWVIFG